jgi:hypothetical protein
MLPPNEDLADRRPLWDAMQMLWMDTDPEEEIAYIVRVCAESKYSIGELEAIYWNEVRPAVQFNMRIPTTPAWQGFNLDWLCERILKKHRYGRPMRWRWYYREAASWWGRLAEGVLAARASMV